jgi:sulfur carrier protein
MEIYVNGELRTVASATSITQLLEALNYTGRRVAVEVNQAIVPRSAYAERVVCAGDRVEIVQAIGGG